MYHQVVGRVQCSGGAWSDEPGYCGYPETVLAVPESTSKKNRRTTLSASSSTIMHTRACPLAVLAEITIAQPPVQIYIVENPETEPLRKHKGQYIEINNVTFLVTKNIPRKDSETLELNPILPKPTVNATERYTPLFRTTF